MHSPFTLIYELSLLSNPHFLSRVGSRPMRFCPRFSPCVEKRYFLRGDPSMAIQAENPLAFAFSPEFSIPFDFLHLFFFPRPSLLSPQFKNPPDRRFDPTFIPEVPLRHPHSILPVGFSLLPLLWLRSILTPLKRLTHPSFL